jgi:hypothetical protein
MRPPWDRCTWWLWGEVFGDLRARVGCSDDEHLASWDLVRVAVLGAVQLGDLVAQLLGDRRCVGALVGATEVPQVPLLEPHPRPEQKCS